MKKIIIIALTVFLILAIVLCAIFLLRRCDKPVQPDDPVYFPGFTPDYPPPPVDTGAEDIGGDESKLEAPEGGGAVGMIYSDEVLIDLSDRKITLRFDNPNQSLQNMSVQILIQGQVVAESGLLQPGKRITSMTLSDEMAAQLPVGIYSKDAKFRVRFFDPETNECAIVQSEILLTVTVRE